MTHFLLHASFSRSGENVKNCVIPKNMFQIVLAKPTASAGVLNPTSAMAPPRLMVTIFPFS